MEDVIYSNETLRRKLWLDQAVACLSDYRRTTEADRAALSNYIGWDLCPSDAAELYQARVSA